MLPTTSDQIRTITEQHGTGELQSLFDEHTGVLRAAVARTGWRTMPDGGSAAIDAGLVVERDPTWQYSDDLRAANGFALTALGLAAVLQNGWICGCAGCADSARRRGWPPSPAVDGMCPGCRGSTTDHGSRELPDGQVSCPMHHRQQEREREQNGTPQ